MIKVTNTIFSLKKHQQTKGMMSKYGWLLCGTCLQKHTGNHTDIRRMLDY